MIDFAPFLLFVIFMVGTPGPANMLLMTSGANFGFWRSLPFVAGVTLGKLLVNIRDKATTVSKGVFVLHFFVNVSFISRKVFSSPQICRRKDL